MAFSVVAGGSTLYIFYPDGTSQALTLPDGVSITARRLRGAVLGRNVVAVHAPRLPIWIDADESVRALSLKKPSVVSVAAGAAGSLSGTFKVKVSFVVKHPISGDVLQESELSDASDSVTVSNELIALSSIPIAPEAFVTGRRFYRTTTGPGTEYFHWFDLDDNSTTSHSEEGSDESLATDAVDENLSGAPPNQIDLVVEWKGRLWAKSPAEPDTLFGTAEGLLYAWPLDFPVGPKGRDSYGITGFLPRRDELGIGKRGIIWKLTGSDEDDFRLVKLVEGIGILAPDTCRVIHDVGYFLGIKEGEVGVYEWSSAGIRNISDEDVYPWFNTDTYFNRGEFKNAFGGYDPATTSYRVYLAAAGGTTINRWVSFDLRTRKWLGPHKTDTFNPVFHEVLLDENEVGIVAVGGSDGKVYERSETRTDGASTAIAMDALTSLLLGEPPTPDIEKYFGELSVVTKKQASGTLTITPTIRTVDASGNETDSAGSAISHAMTKGRQRLRRIGTGRGVQFNFTESTAGQDAEVFGIELPWHELGRR